MSRIREGLMFPVLLFASVLLSIISGYRPASASVFTETWEGGIGDWYADAGVWQVGPPTSGPGTAYHGSQCGATVLGAGGYPRNCNSRLISPDIQLPAAVSGSTLALQFWHWFNVDLGDQLFVEISVGGGPWTRVSPYFNAYGGGWTRHWVDLSSYAGLSIRIAFHIDDDNDGYQAQGWFVDDIAILQDPSRFVTPDSFEEFHPATPIPGGWYAENGTWQIGSPTAGPSAAKELSFCAGTVLNGNYPRYADSRLISASIPLSATPAGGKLWLSFWHWFNVDLGDQLTVEISADNGPWQQVAGPFTTYCGVWTQHVVDVSTYAGLNVRLAFRINDDDDGYQATGWYLDKIAISPGTLVFNNPEGWERGSRDWYATNGVWEVGVPMVGPGSAYSGTSCAGTVLGGDYPRFANSRLVSPEILLPTSPPGGISRLRFYHWFSLDGGDSAIVEMSVASGPWQRLGFWTEGSSGGWTQFITSSLIAYAGMPVRFGFRIRDDSDGYQAAGWYLDSVRMEGYPEGGPGSPTFDFVNYTHNDPPVLTWTNPVDPISHINVYANRLYDFTPDIGDRVAQVVGSSYTDVERPGAFLHYQIAAVDEFMHESAVAVPVDVTAVRDVGRPPRGRVRVEPARPNPFSQATTLRFTLASSERVTVRIFGVDGREVATLLQGELSAGEHQVRLDGGRLSPGIYLYSVQTRAGASTGKVALVR